MLPISPKMISFLRFTPHQATMAEKNIEGGFRGAGLIPYDPERLISDLDVQFKIPTPSNSRPSSSHSWISRTPNNPIEASFQTNLIKSRISRHQDSSPTSILSAVDILVKGTTRVTNKMVLMEDKGAKIMIIHCARVK